MTTTAEFGSQPERPLSRRGRRAIFLAVSLACGLPVSNELSATGLPKEASPPGVPATLIDLLNAIDCQLVPAAPPAIAAAQHATLDALGQLDQTLAGQAVGPLLATELQLGRLRGLLAKVSTDPTPATAAQLEAFGPVLRRVLPGRVQTDLNQLRLRVATLAAVCSRSPPKLAAARRSLANLRRRLAGPAAVLAAADDQQLRADFARVVRLVAAAGLRSRLRQALSRPNAVVQLREPFVRQLARQQLIKPVAIRRVEDGTAITGRGDVQIDLSASLAPSVGHCRLVVRADGHGRIDATAVRRRVRGTAAAFPVVRGSLPIVIAPRAITPTTTVINAELQTRLTTLSIGGLLGHCRLVRRLASREAARQLEAAEPSAARAIEAEVGRTVEEEGLLLAARINTLLRWGVWDRLAAIDFSPDVRLASDQTGATSGTFYARDDQLAALAPPPAVTAEQSDAVAMVTKVHESAVNNLFAGCGNLTLDEATVRALWEVQLKVSDAAWQQLPPARVASTITLQADKPFTVRVAAGGVQITVRPTAGHLAGVAVPAVPTAIRLAYQLEQGRDGLGFRRTACELSGDLDDAAAAAWTELTDLFCGRRLQPLPRYRTSITASWLRMVHAALEDGWLVVVTEMTAAEPSAATSEVPQ